MQKDKIDVIIPAFKAHKTIIRAVSSIACQTVADDVSVVIVDDACPEGDYNDVVDFFSKCLNIRTIRLDKNGGPGVARQTGIDGMDGEFIAFLDADDLLSSTRSLEILRNAIKEDEAYKCASGAFWNEKFGGVPAINISHMMVWVFGKLYRREFLNTHAIRFNNTRANEDSGFNHIVSMLCDNPDEKIRFVDEFVYEYRDDNPNSITSINDGQYWYDQCTLGGIDNMIYAIEHVRKHKPFSGAAISSTVNMMLQCYWYYSEVMQKAKPMSIQLWEYIKKFYHRCYKPIEGIVTDEAFRIEYSRMLKTLITKSTSIGVIPEITPYQFMDKLRTEEYDPNLIYEIWDEMKYDEGFQEIIRNNIACGVCPEGYTDKPMEAQT